MTNAEKYLKDGKATEELIATMENELPLSYIDVAQFWGKPCKPTLTEDERVILRNIENYTFIGRDRENALYVSDKTGIHSAYIDGLFDSLFQFIKERRRIFNSRIVKR